ncbi:MAG TPA: DUF177 domain-containing protein [Proteobacteria bacterium]|nr:hypothetical protein BMS3Abin14_01153 [bacterium BMS3Abin14]HDL53896.1 DUF177 domain-containing protein [Pseudomonadota bacterium]
MLLKLDEIPPEGISIDVELCPDSPEIMHCDVEGPVAGSCRVDRFGSQVLVKGDVRGHIFQNCSRCLKKYLHDVREKFSLDLRSLSHVPEGGELELGVCDLDVEFFQGDTLDLDHLLSEQLSLALPMKPLCSEGCGGLCPLCGQDRTEGKCLCREERLDPRWESLRALKQNDKD